MKDSRSDELREKNWSELIVMQQEQIRMLMQLVKRKNSITVSASKASSKRVLQVRWAL